MNDPVNVDEPMDEENPYSDRDDQKAIAGTLLIVFAAVSAALGVTGIGSPRSMYISASFLTGAGLWGLLRGVSPIGAAFPPLGLALLVVYLAMEPYRLGDVGTAYGAGGMALALFGLAAYQVVRSF